MYKTINGWTKAKMIKQIWAKNNGTASRSPDGLAPLCRYRGDGGNACAVGCFIPDAKYQPQMDENGSEFWNQLKLSIDLQLAMPLNTGALLEMQRVHDTAGNSDPRPLLEKWINENVEDGEL